MKNKLNTGTRSVKKVIDEIENRFLNGERLTKQDIMREYMNCKTPLAYMLAQKKVNGLFSVTLKHRFKKLNLPFGCINEQNQFGIIQTEAEERFAITMYYKLQKGINDNASKVVSYGREMKLLPTVTTENISLLKA